MSLSVKAGSFTANTSTGNQAVTGVGFPPKVVLFMGARVASGDLGAVQNHINKFFGVGISSSKRWCHSMQCEGDSGTTDTDSRISESFCIANLSVTGSITDQADFVSLDADGFTVNWSTAPASAYEVQYLALGGDIEADCGGFTSPASTGNQAYTGVGFEPEALLTSAWLWEDQAVHGTSYNAFGFASGADNESAWNASDANGSATGNTSTWQQTDRVTGVSDSSGLREDANLVSFDADGFTLNWVSVLAGAKTNVYLALRGVSFEVGSFQTPTSTGAVAFDGLSIDPSAVIFSSVGSSTLTSVDSSTGYGDMVSMFTADDQEVFALASADGSASSRCKKRQRTDTTVIDVLSVDSAGTTTDEEIATLTSLDAAGWTLNYTTTDATERYVHYLAIGAPPAAGGKNAFDTNDWSGEGWKF